MNTIRTRFIKMGNSRVLLIPKKLIEKLGLGNEVELIVKYDQLVIQTASKRWEGWKQAFRGMSIGRDAAPHVGSLATNWDETEWEW